MWIFEARPLLGEIRYSAYVEYELCHRRFSRNFQKKFQKSFFKDHRWDASDFV